jgi:hypothetical protein
VVKRAARHFVFEEGSSDGDDGFDGSHGGDDGGTPTAATD